MKKVQVLLSTYNGEKYIDEQIESILKQESVDISILIRDDGSTDQTIKKLKEWAKNDNVQYYEGKNIGPAKSFMELVCKSGDFDYYAFADQDDIWYPNKIVKAIEMLEEKDDKEALYISALEIVDEELNKIEIKHIKSNPTFQSELIKNFATGCTEVFNKKMCYTIKKYNPEFIMMHDSWICRLCYAIGGYVIIDDNAYIKYRQHLNNVLGYKDNVIKKAKKQYETAFKKKINIRVNISQELKKGYDELIVKEAREVIDNVISYRESLKCKMWLLLNRRFRTNNILINVKMMVAILLNKF